MTSPLATRDERVRHDASAGPERDDAPVALQLPQSVAIEVVETPPELKGGTATKRPKPARLSTGIEIQVPEYITTGEKVLVNTSTGEFAGRAD